MNAGGARHLRQAADGLLDLLRRLHHQVGQLVDHDHDVGQFFVVFCLLVKGVEIARAGFLEQVIAFVHLAHRPLQRACRFVQVGHDRVQ